MDPSVDVKHLALIRIADNRSFPGVVELPVESPMEVDTDPKEDQVQFEGNSSGGDTQLPSKETESHSPGLPLPQIQSRYACLMDDQTVKMLTEWSMVYTS